jgi:transketolase
MPPQAHTANAGLDTHDMTRLQGEALAIRRLVLKTLNKSQAGHPGGSLSAVEILTSLYFQVMRIDPAQPNWPERDRFVLSKGHASPVYYATLARRGYFPETELATHDTLNSRLQGHPDMRKTPGVDMSSGSLGQGLSVCVGLALGAKMAGHAYRVYCMLGDGECQEGQVWEAAMSAPKFGLDNLTAIVDWNRLQLMGTVDEIMPTHSLPGLWREMGWEVLEVDGHDLMALVKVLQAPHSAGKPLALLAHTVKGKGVSFMENRVEWHAKPVSGEDLKQALDELSQEGAQ